MMRVRPSRVEGTTAAPASKSASHRAFLLALLSRDSVIRRPLMSDDPRATLAAVQALGAGVNRDRDDHHVHGGRILAPEDVLDCGNSGTTLRLATAIASLAEGATVLTGDQSLRKRPMQPLLDALEPLGVEAFTTRGTGTAPLVVRGPMKGGATTLPGDISSQFVSALVLAGARAPDGVELTLTSPLKSRPYLDLTISMLETFGGKADATDDGFLVPGDQDLPGADYRVPGDWSSAAFPLAAAAVTGGKVTVTNVDPESPQGDKRIVEALRGFGASVDVGDSSVTVEGGSLTGQELDLADTPDMFPVLAAVAAHADGDTVLTGASHLRYKESDRIRAMVMNLRAMGVGCEEREDGAVIRGAPGRVKGARIESHHDHRILMACMVAGLGAEGETRASDDESHAVSYPDFPQVLQRLGADVKAGVGL